MRVGTAHPEQQAVQGERAVAHPLDDAVRAARMEWNHADAQLQPPGFSRRLGQRRQPIRRAGMVHPERGEAQRLGFPRRRAEDLRRRAGEQGEAGRHADPRGYFLAARPSFVSSTSRTSCAAARQSAPPGASYSAWTIFRYSPIAASCLSGVATSSVLARTPTTLAVAA